MDYENPLDHLIHRFQHRWETNPQFRAAMSGVLGLSLIIFLCVGVAGVNAAASRVLGAVGFGSSGGGQGNIDPGGQIVNGNWTFYTPTVPDWKGGATPGSSPINNSQTPQPSPTPTATPPDAPTATPCRVWLRWWRRSNHHGGMRAYPLPLVMRGQSATLTFHTSKPNNPMTIFVHWSNGTDWVTAGRWVYLYMERQGLQTDQATLPGPSPYPPARRVGLPRRSELTTPPESGGGSAVRANTYRSLQLRSAAM